MKSMKRSENLHVFLWLLKDMSWCRSWHAFGLLMVIPTLVLAIKIAKESWHDLADFVHNVAVCLWICANITWMIGEFFFDDKTRPYATIFFVAGVAILIVYYIYDVVKYIAQRIKSDGKASS